MEVKKLGCWLFAMFFVPTAYGAIEWQENQKITPESVMSGDFFGANMDVYADTLVVGASLSAISGKRTGSVYYYEKSSNSSSWDLVQTIVPDGLSEGARFGISIDLEGNLLAISATPFKPLGSDECASDITLMVPGIVFIYELDPVTRLWAEVKRITPEDSQICDEFGISVELDGDVLYVGSRFAPDPGNYSGGVYIFRKNQGGDENWGQSAKITGLPGETEFGSDVAVDGNNMVIGARRLNDSTGAAFLYQRNSPASDDWTLVKSLTSQSISSGDEYGIAVDITGDWVAVSATLNDVQSSNAGSVSLFNRNSGGIENWGVTQLLLPTPSGVAALFGQGLRFDDNRLYIGARTDPPNALRVGELYEYSLDNDSGLWLQTAQLTGSDTIQSDTFSFTFGIDGGNLVVGATRDDDNGADSGSAYSFQFESDVQVIVDSDLTVIPAGESFIYRVLVQNAGTSLVSGTKVDINLGPDLQATGIAGCPANTTNFLVCQIGDLMPGSFIQYEVTIQSSPLSEGFRTSSAEVTSDAIDTNLINNSDLELVEIIGNEDLVFVDSFEDL